MSNSEKHHSIQGQILDLNVTGCVNLSNKQLIGKQDPYVIIEYAGRTHRTRTHTDGARNPSFNEVFKISLIEGLREVTAHVWNSNSIERDDYIGSTKIWLNKVIDNGYDETQWPLTNNRTSKSAGMLKLILHYSGSGKNKPAKCDPTPHQPVPYGGYTQPGPSHGYPPPPCGVQIPTPVLQPQAPCVYGSYFAPSAPPQPQPSMIPVYSGPPPAHYPRPQPQPQPVAYFATGPTQSQFYNPAPAPAPSPYYNPAPAPAQALCYYAASAPVNPTYSPVLYPPYNSC